MARCQCAGSSCSCLITAGPGTTVQGVGTADQPYVVSSVSNVYSNNFTAASPVYPINAPFQTEIGSRALFLFTIDPGVTAIVALPNGSSSAPNPVVGAEFDVIANGTLGGSSGITFSGAAVTWFGAAPTTSTLGLYRFIWTGTNFAGTWTPYR